MAGSFEKITDINGTEDIYILVNGQHTKCTVEPNQTEIKRNSIEGNMLTLYKCITVNQIQDTSGFWIHQDCLEGKKIKKNTFPESDDRKSLNGQEISIDKAKSKGVYKFVTTQVNRREFLRQKEEIYVETAPPGAEVEAQQVLARAQAEKALAAKEAQERAAAKEAQPQPLSLEPPTPPAQSIGFNPFF